MNGGWSLRGAGSDAAETELQADVMRFVAILALCLVAISTLVEQATSRETPAEGSRSAAALADPRPLPEPVQAEPVSVTTPVSPTPPPPSSTRVADAGVVTPVPEPAPEPAMRATPAPRPEPVAVARPVPEPSPPPIPDAEPSAHSSGPSKRKMDPCTLGFPSSTQASFVEVSPSTVIALKLGATAFSSAFCSRGLATRASVAT